MSLLGTASSEADGSSGLFHVGTGSPVTNAGKSFPGLLTAAAGSLKYVTRLK